MKKLIIGMTFVLSACAGPVVSAPTQFASTPLPTLPVSVKVPTEILPSPTPTPQRTDWLLLGLDHRKHRTGTGEGNHTDVIVLVSVLEVDPIEITVVQFPRNLWVPIEGQDDQWLFTVYGNESWQGLHQWFDRALGVNLQGIFVINMDQWVVLIDDLDGLKVVTTTGLVEMGGEDTLVYLRDNENNWNFGSYDKEERVFRILESFWARGLAHITEDPLSAGRIAFDRWGGLFESDLANVKQIYWVFELGWKLKSNSTKVTFLQLEEPVIERGDTPLPVRGMIPATDLKIWMDCIMSNQETCGP